MGQGCCESGTDFLLARIWICGYGVPVADLCIVCCFAEDSGYSPGETVGRFIHVLAVADILAILVVAWRWCSACGDVRRMHEEEHRLIGLFLVLMTLMGLLSAFVSWKEYLPDDRWSL